MLEAFFIGRAFAEVLNERLNELLGEGLARLGVREAEVRKALDNFRDEVLARARGDMGEHAGGSSSSSGGRPSSQLSSGGGGRSRPGSSGRGLAAGAAAGGAPTVEFSAQVDGLRADIASTRAVVQQVRRQQQQAGSKGKR